MVKNVKKNKNVTTEQYKKNCTIVYYSEAQAPIPCVPKKHPDIFD